MSIIDDLEHGAGYVLVSGDDQFYHIPYNMNQLVSPSGPRGMAGYTQNNELMAHIKLAKPIWEVQAEKRAAAAAASGGNTGAQRKPLVTKTPVAPAKKAPEAPVKKPAPQAPPAKKAPQAAPVKKSQQKVQEIEEDSDFGETSDDEDAMFESSEIAQFNEPVNKREEDQEEDISESDGLEENEFPSTKFDATEDEEEENCKLIF